MSEALSKLIFVSGYLIDRKIEVIKDLKQSEKETKHGFKRTDISNQHNSSLVHIQTND